MTGLTKITKIIKTEYKYILIITLFFIIAAVFFRYKMTDLYIDFGRETIIPQAIIEGKVLYKDIFSIYFPLSYLLNAVFLKIFGINLTTYNLLGFFNTYIIFISIYFISRNFLDRLYCALLSLFTLFVCAIVPSVTNYVTPYSYAAVYGLSSICLCTLCTFSYLKSAKTNFLYPAFLFAGIALANKFDYIFCIIPLISIVIYKKCKIKTLCYCLLLWILPLLLSFLILMIQGLTIPDYLNYADIINRYLKSPLLHRFYKGTMTFSLKEFFSEVILLGISVFAFLSVFNIIKFFENKNIKYIEYIIFAFLTVILCKAEIFSAVLIFHYFPLLLFLLIVLKFQKIKTNQAILFLTAMTFAFGIKSLFLLNTAQYGRYFLPLYAVCITAVVCNYCFMKNSSAKYKTIAVMLAAIIVANFYLNLNNFKYYSHKIQTQKGIVYASEKDKKIFDHIINYINVNTNKNDKIVVLRENSIINFLTDRKTDDFYNHFENISFYAFGENNIINHYAQTKPDYFIIFTSQTDNNAFCNGYAQNTCMWIEKNYNLKQVIKSEPLILIFQKI